MTRVLVADDQALVRGSFRLLVETAPDLTAVGEAQDGVAAVEMAGRVRPDVVLMDVRMPEMDGIEVQHALREQGVFLPVVVMTGHGDVDLAVRAMKAGATDFIEKPFEKAVLLGAMDTAFAELERAGRRHARSEEARARLQVLTPREMDVMQGLVRGFPNKTIAYDLGISSRTVEIHRANLMSKLAVPSLSEALRIGFAAGLGNSGDEED